MKIVVLDGYCANPGDLSWEAIGSMGELTVYDRTAPQDVLSRAQGAQAIYTNKTVLNAETLRQLPYPVLRQALLAAGVHLEN